MTALNFPQKVRIYMAAHGVGYRSACKALGAFGGKRTAGNRRIRTGQSLRQAEMMRRQKLD
jgi:hypothetical protein